MTLITRYDPFRELVTLQDRVNSLFEGFSDVSGKEQLAAGTFVPPVDIYEDEQNLVLKLEIPGVNEEDLQVSLENNLLTVKGERKFEKEENEENFHRIERRFGTFTRTFPDAQHRGQRLHLRQLRQRNSEDHAGQARRSQAKADQDRRRPADPATVRPARIIQREMAFSSSAFDFETISACDRLASFFCNPEA